MQEPDFHVLRGQRIEEFTNAELVAVHQMIDRELPTLIDHLSRQDMNRLLELEMIENELERRHEKIQ
jgi:hypothetical protein